MASAIIAGAGELIELIVTAVGAETAEVLAVGGDVIGETAATAAATTTAETSFITETADVVALAETYGGATAEAVGEAASVEQIAEAGVIGEQIAQMDAVVVESVVEEEMIAVAAVEEEIIASSSSVVGEMSTEAAATEAAMDVELETTIESEFETAIDEGNFITQRASTPIRGAARVVRSQRGANIATRQFEREFFAENSLVSRPLRALNGAARSRFVYTDLPSAIEAPVNSFVNELTTGAESSFAAAIDSSSSTLLNVTTDSLSVAPSSSTFIYPEGSTIGTTIEESIVDITTIPKVPYTPTPAPAPFVTIDLSTTIPPVPAAAVSVPTTTSGFQLFSHATGTVNAPLLGSFGLSVAALLYNQFPDSVNKVVTSITKYLGILKKHIPDIESVLQELDLSTTAKIFRAVYDLDVMLYNTLIKKKYGTINLQILLSNEQNTGLDTLEEHRQDGLTLLLDESVRGVPSTTKEGSTLTALLDTRNFLTVTRK